MGKKVHLIAEEKNFFDKPKTLCGVLLKNSQYSLLEFETDKNIFLESWSTMDRCKRCETILFSLPVPKTIIKITDKLSVLVEEAFIKEGEYFELGGEVLCNCSMLTDELCKSKQNKVVGTIGTAILIGVPVFKK